MKCHQRVIREQQSCVGDKSFVKDLVLTKNNCQVNKITYAEAKTVILKYEWLGTMPNGCSLCVGGYFQDKLAGVECFTAVKGGNKYSLNNRPAICLSRGACVDWAPDWFGSFLIRKSLNFLNQDDYHFVLCYSDTDAGEVGTCYQAANFVCLGKVSNEYWLSPLGQRRDMRYHRVRVLKKCPDGKKRVINNEHLIMKEQMLKEGWVYKTGGSRYRYAEAIGRGRVYRERRKFLESLAVPFPKREKIYATEVSI